MASLQISIVSDLYVLQFCFHFDKLCLEISILERSYILESLDFQTFHQNSIRQKFFAFLNDAIKVVSFVVLALDIYQREYIDYRGRYSRVYGLERKIL